MSRKRFFTDYPDGRWRRAVPRVYDGDKYVSLLAASFLTANDCGEIKLGYLRHGRPHGPRVSHAYATRFFRDWYAQDEAALEAAKKGARK